MQEANHEAADRIVCLAALAALLTGCGEKDQVVVYKQGQYQGKPDGKPWDNESFAGDRTQWEATDQGAQPEPERISPHQR
jgi:major membrane immunogen (membrane-anchored lipoprotein)